MGKKISRLGGYNCRSFSGTLINKTEFPGAICFFFRFFQGVWTFLNQNIKAEKVCPPPVWLFKWNSPIVVLLPRTTWLPEQDVSLYDSATLYQSRKTSQMWLTRYTRIGRLISNNAFTQPFTKSVFWSVSGYRAVRWLNCRRLTRPLFHADSLAAVNEPFPPPPGSCQPMSCDDPAGP